MRELNREQIIDVLNGATLLGGGGGGSLSNGIEMLNNFEKVHGEAKLKLITPEEMDPNKYVAITAGMGSPKAIIGKDFSKYAINAYNYLKEIASEMNPPKNIDYCTAVECGGFNTFVPMMISLLEDKQYIDADGAGRAVPALETLLLNVNGCDTSPIVMASDNDDRVLLQMANKKDAKLCEDIGRGVCVAMGMLAGISGWMVNQEEVQTKLATNTVTRCEEIGKLLKEIGTTDESVFEKLENARTLCKGTITNILVEIRGGFDYGETTIVDDETKDEWLIKFINENIVIYKKVDGEFKPQMTAPEIITMYEQKTALPLTNADTKIGQKVVVGAIAASKEWWFTPESNVYEFWKTYYEACEYKGGILHF